MTAKRAAGVGQAVRLMVGVKELEVHGRFRVRVHEADGDGLRRQGRRVIASHHEGSAIDLTCREARLAIWYPGRGPNRATQSHPKAQRDHGAAGNCSYSSCEISRHIRFSRPHEIDSQRFTIQVGQHLLAQRSADTEARLRWREA